MERWERPVDGALYQFLCVMILDDADRLELAQHSACQHIQIELSALDCLSAFPAIHSLIITSGIPTAEGFAALYAHTELERLVLDYEETDSDEEGIDLTRFPNLQYVISRSNLNILNYAPGMLPDVRIEVYNTYRNGKPVGTVFPDSFDLLPKCSFLSFSLEVSQPAGSLLSNMLFPVGKVFTDKQFGVSFSEQLDSFLIVPICISPTMVSPEAISERRYISWKKRKADVRLKIPFDEFVTADRKTRLDMLWNNLVSSIEYVRRKDKTLQVDKLLSALRDAFDAVHS